MKTFCCVLLAGLFLNLSIAVAEEAAPLTDKTGKWTFSMGETGADLKSIPADRQKKIRSSLQDIARLVTATSVMNPPKGFEARFWGNISARDRFDICGGKKCPQSRPTATLAMMIGRYEDRGGVVKAAFNSPSTMDISINNLGHVFAHLPVLLKDADGYLLPEPQPDEDRAGMKTFSNNNHTVAVLTRNDAPLWQPVSRERYLMAAIEAAAKDAGELPPPPPRAKKSKKKTVATQTPDGKPTFIEEQKSWIDPVEEKQRIEKSRTLTFGNKESAEFFKERVEKLRADLATMPPEERAMQARVDIIASADEQTPALLPAGSSSGTPVVTPDFRYFNQKLPVDAIQIMTVQWKFSGNPVFDPQKSGITENLNNQKLLEIYKSMDWKKLNSRINRTGT